MRPDFVVDDHPHLVSHFGGVLVRRYLRADPTDTEMLRVHNAIRAAHTKMSGISQTEEDPGN